MRSNVKQVVKEILARKGRVTSGEVAAAAGLTRQAVHLHLRAMVAAGELVIEGHGRATSYRAARPSQADLHVELLERSGLSESDVFDRLAPRLLGPSASPEVRTLVEYAFTEMLNNAIDHSESERIEVRLERAPELLAFEIVDEGVGIFRRIDAARRLGGEVPALQELSKGKLTTQPERHTGEGIFFTSKAADLFEVESGTLRWTVDNLRGEQAVAACDFRRGTRVRFEVSPAKRRRLEDVFAEYTDNFQFSRTRAVVKLFEYGTRFVSRSEAKRLTQGLERFREVIVDFEGVAGVGQGFVDELFRVWAAAHPEVRLTPTHMNPAVEFMVRRGLPTSE